MLYNVTKVQRILQQMALLGPLMSCFNNKKKRLTLKCAIISLQTHDLCSQWKCCW